MKKDNEKGKMVTLPREKFEELTKEIKGLIESIDDNIKNDKEKLLKRIKEKISNPEVISHYGKTEIERTAITNYIRIVVFGILDIEFK